MASRRRKDESISSIGRLSGRVSGKFPPYIAPPTPPPQPEDRGKWLRFHLRQAFLGNLGLKFLSLVLALTVFLLVNTDREREITARVGVSYTLPGDRVLVSERLTEVRVGLRGPWRKLRRFDERSIDRIDIDLRNAKDGEVPLTPDMVHLPAGMSLTSISPSSLRVAFERRVERTVEVSPLIAGRPEHGFKVEVAQIKVDPPTVKVSGAEGVIKALDTLRTREIRVDGMQEEVATDVELVPPEGVDVEPSGPVRVSVPIVEQLETKKLGKLAVRVQGTGIDPIGFIVDPPAVEIVLTGKLLAVEDAVKNGVVPIVRIAPGEAGKRHIAAVEVLVGGGAVPEGVGVEKVPAKVEVRPVPKRPPKPAPPPTLQLENPDAAPTTPATPP